MWTRKQLKQRAKMTFKGNYWKCVLISVIFLLLGGAGSTASSLSGLTSTGSAAATGETLAEAGDDSVTTVYAEEDSESLWEAEYGLQSEIAETSSGSADQLPSEVTDLLTEEEENYEGSTLSVAAFLLIAILVFILILLVSIAVVVLVTFVVGPVEIGAKRFFIKNLEEKAEVKEIGYGYDHAYMRNVVTLLFKDLFTFLWSLLFLIPGIIKGYEYSMIPYLMAEHPEMTRQEVFAYSKELMRGNKWRAFVLDLSFIGWKILAFFTLGILNIFYVNPYYNQTRAAFYKAVCQEYEEKMNAIEAAV